MTESARAQLARAGLRPKKRLGQHFLTEPRVALRIAEYCRLEPPAPVVEVGPGTGALTLALAQLGVPITAIEIDADLVALLRARADLAAVRVVEGDALEFDYDAHTEGKPWCAAGNLPYNVATPLILRWLDLHNVPERIVAMVQRDVADRFGAKPSTPAYGSLTLSVAYRMQVERVMTLAPGAFYPSPAVESAVVVMRRRAAPPVSVWNETFFYKIVRAAFAYRRKTLANSLQLALGIHRERSIQELRALRLDSGVRGEQLDIEAFAAFANGLATEEPAERD